MSVSKLRPSVPRLPRLPRLSPQAREFGAAALLIALAALGITALVALVVHFFFIHGARRTVDLTMAGLPARDLGEWWSVFSWNLRHLIVPLAASALVWLRGSRPSRTARWFEVLVGLFVLEELAINILWIGEALGGYGAAAASWLVPHGPLELAAYATALAVWVQALRGRLGLRLAASAAAFSVVLLAAAAAIETELR